MWLLLWYIWFCRPFVFCLFRVAFFYTSRTLFFQAVAPLHSHLFRFVILLWTRPHDQVTRSLYSWLCYIVFPECLLFKAVVISVIILLWTEPLLQTSQIAFNSTNQLPILYIVCLNWAVPCFYPLSYRDTVMAEGAVCYHCTVSITSSILDKLIFLSFHNIHLTSIIQKCTFTYVWMLWIVILIHSKNNLEVFCPLHTWW